MEHSSYVELNIVCMLFLGIIYVRLFNNRSIISSSQIYMKRLILTSCILCASDIVAVLCRGQFFAGARVFIEISNLIYFEAMPMISLFWLKYVFARLGKPIKGKKNVLVLAPLIVFTAFAVTNPLTNFLFSIDESNLYVRGSGVFIHWIISWIYLVAAAYVSHKEYKIAQSWNRKNECRPLLIFIVFPTIGCLIQMMVYGISAVQVGITLSIFLVNFQMQDNRISIDELTGINNRKEMRLYVDRLINRYKHIELSVIMIDVNRFKQINDTYGHSTGDEALRDVANALKRVCEKHSEHMFLCRYGGDEFVIVRRGASKDAFGELKTALENEVLNVSIEKSRPYDLSISVGNATKACTSMVDFEKCIKLADEAMYVEKKQTKVTR